MASHLEAAFSADRQFRLSDDAAPEAGSRMIVHEIRPGFVLDRNGVRVTTIEVDHSPVRPVYGYRIDYAGHWVVLSGDTRFSEAVIAAATDADLLVHEIAERETIDVAGDGVVARAVGLTCGADNARALTEVLRGISVPASSRAPG